MLISFLFSFAFHFSSFNQSAQMRAGCHKVHRSVAERSYPLLKARGGTQEELHHVQGQDGGRECQAVRAQEWLRGATPCARSGVVAERSNPTSKERWLHECGRTQRNYSTFIVRRGGCEEIPLVQGKEQQLRFAGAAMKRYPMSKVREIQVRQ